MALLNEGIGAKIYFSIGSKGGPQDVYAGRIVSRPTVGAGPRGPQKTATIITHQKNLNGEWFLNERLADLRFCRDRTEMVEVLDGTEEAPKSVPTLVAERNASLDAFLASREQAVSVADAMAESAPADA